MKSNSQFGSRAAADPEPALAAVTFECFGARLRLHCSDRGILRELTAFLPPGSRIRRFKKADATFLIERNLKRRSYVISNEIPDCPNKKAVHRTMEGLASELHFPVALFGRPYLFVHAGVVAWHGHAILIPGRSMNGKSTMVEALVKHGAVYYSDEYAVIDARGRIHPYRKPLALRARRGAQSISRFIPSPGMNGRQKPLEAGVVAFLKYKADARWSPRNLTPGEAVLSLLDNTVLARARAKFALRVLGMLVRRGIAIKTFRPDAAIAAPAMLDLASRTIAGERNHAI